MSVDAEIIETIDAVLGGDHTARIGQDAARIEELASRLRGSGLRGVRDRAGAGGRAAPARHAPRGHAARLAVKQCKSRCWKFFVHEDDMEAPAQQPP